MVRVHTRADDAGLRAREADVHQPTCTHARMGRPRRFAESRSRVRRAHDQYSSVVRARAQTRRRCMPVVGSSVRGSAGLSQRSESRRSTSVVSSAVFLIRVIRVIRGSSLWLLSVAEISQREHEHPSAAWHRSSSPAGTSWSSPGSASRPVPPHPAALGADRRR